MTLDIEKIKAAAMADTEDGLQWSSTGILELITRLEEEISISNQRGEALETAWCDLSALTHKLEAAEKDATKYKELIYAVASKFPDETCHETALRYIKRCEAPTPASAAMKESA